MKKKTKITKALALALTLGLLCSGLAGCGQAQSVETVSEDLATESVQPVSYTHLDVYKRQALFYPDRRPMPGKRLDFYELAQITFEKPDMETFFGLKLAYDAQRIGGSMPTVYNAANEKAVGLFLDRKIAYLQIPELIREAMEQHKVIENPNVEEILETEASVYDFIEKVYSERQ